MTLPALSVGDDLPQGRVVAIQEPTESLKGYVWVERRLPDGSAVEREMFFFDEIGLGGSNA